MKNLKNNEIKAVSGAGSTFTCVDKYEGKVIGKNTIEFLFNPNESKIVTIDGKQHDIVQLALITYEGIKNDMLLKAYSANAFCKEKGIPCETVCA